MASIEDRADAFCDRLALCRKSLGLTQSSIASLYGVSRPCYSSWETGKNEPPFRFLTWFCSSYGISADYLLGLSNLGEGILPGAAPSSSTSTTPDKEVVFHDPVSIGNRIRNLREEADLSQKDLADLRKVSQSTIAKQESGQSGLSEGDLLWYANHFSVSVDYLLGLTKATPAAPNLSDEQMDEIARRVFRMIIGSGSHGK